MVGLDDKQIREALHRKRLKTHHRAANTLVVNELGLNHGMCRADIAVINGHLSGYEIKSDKDTLTRLPEQVRAYSDVFDRATVVVGAKYASQVLPMVPEWWGVIVTQRGPRDGICFESVRQARINRDVHLFSVAQLLWKSEAIGLLAELGVPPKALRQNRSELYGMLVEVMTPASLRRKVRDCLRARSNWRCPAPPSPCGG